MAVRKLLLQLHARLYRLDINSIYRANFSIDFDYVGFRESSVLGIGFHEPPPERKVTNSLNGRINDCLNQVNFCLIALIVGKTARSPNA
jgi:hypothetical protein